MNRHPAGFIAQLGIVVKLDIESIRNLFGDRQGTAADALGYRDQWHNSLLDRLLQAGEVSTFFSCRCRQAHNRRHHLVAFLKNIQVPASVKRTGRNRAIALIHRISKKRAKLRITIKKEETKGGEIIRTRHIM
jgi:hypothetical protein